MNRISDFLSDPAWWFTAVFVAVLASVAAAFIKDAIVSFLAGFTRYFRDLKQRRDAEIEKEVALILGDPRLLAIAIHEATIRWIMPLFSLGLFFVLNGLLMGLSKNMTPMGIIFLFCISSGFGLWGIWFVFSLRISIRIRAVEIAQTRLREKPS